MRRIGFNECDSADEVCGWLNKIFANQEQMEAKIVQNAQEIEAMKKKGKTKMKSKGSASIRIIGIVMLIMAIAGLCIAAYVPGDINYDIASNPESLSIYLRDVTNNMRSNSYVFTPRVAAPPLPALGMVYYNSGTNNWVGYDDTGWTNFAVAAGGNLDDAYNNGVTILANDGAVVISNAEGDAAPLLNLTYTGGAFDAHGLIVTTNATGAAIEIENTGTGADLEGTAGWTISNAGALIAATADFTAAGGITLQNDETITNADGSIVFTDDSGFGNTLIFDLDVGGTEMLIDSGDVVTLGFGIIDNFTGLESITFDDITSTISLTGSGTNDLIITQLGAGTTSLVLNSDGDVVDAVTIVASVGGIDVDSTDDINITVTSEGADADLLLNQVTANDSSIILTAAGTTNAIQLQTTHLQGDIVLIAGDNLDFDSTGDFELDSGAVAINATTDVAPAIALTTDGGTAETIVITNTQGDTAGAITIVGTAGGIDVDAVDDIIITVASTAAGDDLQLIQTGGVNASISMATAGTGVDAIDIAASAGGIDIDAALGITIDNSDAGEDISITSALGSVNITGTQDIADSVVITSTTGGIDILAAAAGGGDDIDILNTGGSINLVATESAVDSIVLQSTLGGIDIQCDAATSEDIDILNTGGSVNLYATENAADSIVIQSTLGGIDIQCDASGDEDIDIANVGGNVHIASDAAANDAFDLDVTGAAGGVDIDTTDGPIIMTTAGAINGDVTIDASDKISIISSDVQAAGILLQVDGGAAETIHINSTTGTTAAAINIDADVGGITLLADGDAAGDILIDAEDKITIVSTDDHAAAIDISVGVGAAASTIIVTNTSGTAVSLAEAETAAIQLYADAGGIGLNSGFSGDNAIRIEADGGVDENIFIHSNQGTGADSVTLLTDLGGIALTSTAGPVAINANGDASTFTLTADAGGEDLTIAQDGAQDASVILDSVGTGLNAIHLYEHAGVTTGGILIQAAAGVGVSVADAATSSIQLLSDAGGIGIQSNINAANAIRIETSGGVLDTLVIHASDGTDEGSIAILSDLGGIDIDAPAGKNVAINGGQILIESEDDGASSISLLTNTGTAETIVLINTLGQTVSAAAAETAAIQLYADAGGIGLNSGVDAVNAIRIETDGGTAETLVINANQGDTATSITIASDDGGVTISGGADDSITMTTGAAGGAAGNVIFTNGQTRKEVLDGLGQVVPDGASPPAAIGAKGTNGNALLWTWEFEADAGADELVFLNWRVPDGYITDSARLNVIWSYDAAEGDGDTVDFDFTVQATAPGAAATGGEAWEVGGTAGDVVVETLTSGSTTENTLIITQINIDGTGEVIAPDDLVTIMFWVDASETDFAADVAVDVHTFEIEWESTE